MATRLSNPRRVPRVRSAIISTNPDPVREGVLIAIVRGHDPDGILVDLPEGKGAAYALACLCDPRRLGPGASVAVSFDAATNKPVILGVVTAGLGHQAAPAPEVPERLVLAAATELTLRCGKASLTLTADGNAALRGVNVTTRAAATNRIRGGNVQIN